MEIKCHLLTKAQVRIKTQNEGLKIRFFLFTMRYGKADNLI